MLDNQYYLWTRRGSNPRPNKGAIRFLHAYRRLDFRVLARPTPPTNTLSFKKFARVARPTQTSTDLSAPPCQVASGQERLGDVSFQHLVSELSLVYYTSIRQREQSCFRQLNCWRPWFKWPPPGSLHAYAPIRLAVKSNLALDSKLYVSLRYGIATVVLLLCMGKFMHEFLFFLL